MPTPLSTALLRGAGRWQALHFASVCWGAEAEPYLCRAGPVTFQPVSMVPSKAGPDRGIPVRVGYGVAGRAVATFGVLARRLEHRTGTVSAHSRVALSRLVVSQDGMVAKAREPLGAAGAWRFRVLASKVSVSSPGAAARGAAHTLANASGAWVRKRVATRAN